MNSANTGHSTDANKLVISLANTLLALCDTDREAVIIRVRQQELRRRRVVLNLGDASSFGVIALIKAVRDATGMGLADSKAAVDSMTLPGDLQTQSMVDSINAEFAVGLNRLCGFHGADTNTGASVRAYIASGRVPCTFAE